MRFMQTTLGALVSTCCFAGCSVVNEKLALVVPAASGMEPSTTASLHLVGVVKLLRYVMLFWPVSDTNLIVYQTFVRINTTNAFFHSLVSLRMVFSSKRKHSARIR
ncbi:unnamed protein product [Ixodes persulcatus]